MKKRFIFTALVAILAFAMISCDDGGGGGSSNPENVTISFELEDQQYASDFTGTIPTTPVTIKYNTSLGAQFPADLVYSGSGVINFKGWFDGNAKASSTTPFKKDTVLKARFGADTRIDITFYDFDGTGNQIVATLKVEQNEVFSDSGQTFPTPTRTGPWQFYRWVTSTGAPASASDSFAVPTALYGKWWSTTLTADGAIEKVWLGNTQYAIYAFNIGSADVTKISSLKASFKLSEAEIEAISLPDSDPTGNRKVLRPLRAMGPYFYSTTAGPTSGNATFFGDFAIDANSAYAAKFNSSGAATIADFNKFHPYLLSNATPTIATLGGYDSSGASVTEGTKPTADTWFTVTLAVQGYTWNGADNSISRNITDRTAIEAGDATADPPVDPKEILNSATTFTTVYFGIGLANDQDADGAGKGHNATVWRHGITSLVKDVTITFSDGTSPVTGTIPSFAKYPVTWGGSGAPTLGTASGTTDQVFASYIYAIQYNWRGAVSADVVPPKDPTYDPTRPPLATEDLDLGVPALTFMGYGNNNKGDGERTIATLSGATFTVNATADDLNDGGTQWGGGGFYFSIPADYRAYKTIQVTGTVSNVTGAAQFVIGGGTDSWNNVGGWPANLTDGERIFELDALKDWGTDATAGVSFRVNNYNSANVPQGFTFVLTNVTLIAE